MAQLSVGAVGLGLGRHHVVAYARAETMGRLVLCDAWSYAGFCRSFR
jgi:hypothetical protein